MHSRIHVYTHTHACTHACTDLGIIEAGGAEECRIHANAGSLSPQAGQILLGMPAPCASACTSQLGGDPFRYAQLPIPPTT